MIGPGDRIDPYVLRQVEDLAARISLPLRARGRSLDELAARDRRQMLVRVPLAFALLWFILFVVDPWPTSLPVRVAIGIAVSILAVFGLRWELRRRRHAAPQTTVEVTPDGVAVRAPGRSEETPYPDLAVHLSCIPYGRSRRLRFVGIVLETEAGLLYLDDHNFEDGRRAAAAVVARLDAIGRRPLADP